MKPVEISVTCASREEASRIGDLLLTNRLVACTQSWPIESRYWWNGEIVTDNEHVLLVKTMSEKFDDVAGIVMSCHSYELPAIVMHHIEQCNEGYVEWIKNSIK